MKPGSVRRSDRGGRFGVRGVFVRATAVLLAVGAAAYGAQVTIFQDDFQGYTLGTNPGTPPIGEPWQISEAAPDGLDVSVDPLDPMNQVLRFDRYRNIAVAPFSALDRQRIALERNATIRFDYFGVLSHSAYNHYFDIGAYSPIGSDPAFFLRISPQESPGQQGYHDVQYLDPAGGLRDSGLDIREDVFQTLTIAADFGSATYQLDIGGSAATLPMFTCPEEIVGVQFANYAIGSGGVIDNLSVTVTEPDSGSASPELASIWMAMAGILALVGIWAVQRYVK